jgi:hypothetical protein
MTGRSRSKLKAKVAKSRPSFQLVSNRQIQILCMARNCRQVIPANQLVAHCQGPHHEMTIKSANRLVQRFVTGHAVLKDPTSHQIDRETDARLNNCQIDSLASNQTKSLADVCTSFKLLPIRANYKPCYPLIDEIDSEESDSELDSDTDSQIQLQVDNQIQREIDSQIQRHIDNLFDQILARVETEEPVSIIRPTNFNVTTRWLNNTGWVRFLDGYDRQRLHDLVNRQPDSHRDGSSLIAVWSAMSSLLKTANEVLQALDSILLEAGGRTQLHRKARKPLQWIRRPETVASYARIWQQLLLAIGRTRKDVSTPIPNLRLNSSQHKAWARVLAVAQ